MSVISGGNTGGGNNVAARVTTARAQYKGQKVRLKTGGPEMTVNEVVPSPLGPILACVWFDNTTLTKEGFSPEAVDLIP